MWPNFSLSNLYTDLITNLNSRLQDVGKLFNGVATSGQEFVDQVRFNSATGRLERYTGSEWVDLGLTVAVAASCSGNAATATSAGSCTGNAATATSAATCTGNAATATDAHTVDGFHASATPGVNIVPVAGSNGRLAMGFKPAFRGASVYMSANQSIPNATGTAVVFSNESYDTDNIHPSGSSANLVVPTGVTKIRLVGQVSFAANGTGYRWAFFTLVSGTGLPIPSEMLVPTSPVSAATRLNIVSDVFTTTAGSIFNLAVQQTSGGALDLQQTGTYFAMEIIE
jgi:hypothetical protein